MATDNWYVPEADAAEQATTDDDVDRAPDDETPNPPAAGEADEADTLEQARELPDTDEYREGLRPRRASSM